MTTTLLPGQTAYRQWGALNIRIDMHTTHVAITVDHVPGLNRSFTNNDQGRAYLEYLRDEAKAGKPMWLIEAGAGVLTSTAVADAAEQDLIDSVNATMDAGQPQGIDVSDIITDIKAASEARIEKAIQRAERVNERRDYSKTRVHCKPPTSAGLAAIRHHTVNPDGTLTVRRLPGQPWTTLKGLYDRIGGTPTRKRTRITALTYRPEQLAAYLTERAA